MKGLKRKIAIFTLVAFPALAPAEIYKWVDENGKTHYGDKAPHGVKAEKKEYKSVATPWRAVPKETYARPDADSEETAAQDGDPDNVSEQSPNESEKSDQQEPSDTKSTRKEDRNKSIKAKKKAGDTENTASKKPAKLKDQDKASENSPNKRISNIKEKNKQAKEDYRKSKGSTANSNN